MVGPAVLLVRKSPLVSLDQTGVGAGSAPFLGQAHPGGPPGAWNAHAICRQWRSTQEGEQALGTVMPAPSPVCSACAGIWRRSALGPGGDKSVGVISFQSAIQTVY